MITNACRSSLQRSERRKQRILRNFQYNHGGIYRRNSHYFGRRHHKLRFCWVHDSGLSKQQDIQQAHMASEAALHKVPAQQSASQRTILSSSFLSLAQHLDSRKKRQEKEEQNCHPQTEIRQFNPAVWIRHGEWHLLLLGPAALARMRKK